MSTPGTIFQWRGANGRLTGAAAILIGVSLVIFLFVVSVCRHPESIEGAGRRYLVMDAALLLLYAVLAVCAAIQRSERFATALGVGVPLGYALGSVHIAHHLVEFLFPFTGPIASLALGAGHVLLALALFAVAGTIAWERTRFVRLAVASAVWSAMLSVLILVAFAFVLQLAFESKAEAALQEPFRASAMRDAGAFLVKNSLQAASEMLVRFPVLAFFMALVGALASAWMNARARNYALVTAWLAPLMFTAGALSLFYANSLERSLRPPFVMVGLLFAGISLAVMPATWSALWRSQSRS
jgi:hypothetical protein